MTDVNPEDDRVVDLNKARAARYEKVGKGPTVVFGENTFQCPPEVPFAVIEAFGKMEKAQATNDSYESSVSLINAIKGILGDDQYASFDAEQPSTDDMVAFVEGVFKLYGLNAGESSASAES